MQRKTGDIKCWNCDRWITKKGNLCPYCGRNKEQSRKLVEAREDQFITLSIKWLVVSLLLALVPGVIIGSSVIFFLASLLFFFPGLVVSYFWTGMAGA